MDPLTMMLLGGGVSVLGNLFGLGGSAKASKKYDSYLSAMNNRVNAFYNNKLYGDYLDTEEAKSALRLLTEQQKEANDDLKSSAAITGASAEKQVAQKDKLNKNYTQAVTGFAGQGGQLKRQYADQYRQERGRMDMMKLQNMMMKMQNWNQLGQNASGIGQNMMLSGLMQGTPKFGQASPTSFFPGFDNIMKGLQSSQLPKVYGQ